MRVNLGTYENQEAILNKQTDLINKQVNLGTKANQNAIIKNQTTIMQNQKEIKELLSSGSLSEVDYRASVILSNINDDTVRWAMSYEKIGDIFYNLALMDGIKSEALKEKTISYIESNPNLILGVSNSKTAMSAIVSSERIMRSIIKNDTVRQTIFQNSNSMISIVNNSKAMNIVVNDKTTWSMILNNTSMMQTILNSKNSKRVYGPTIISGKLLPLKASTNYTSEAALTSYNSYTAIGNTLGDWLRANKENPISTAIKVGGNENWVEYYDLNA